MTLDLVPLSPTRQALELVPSAAKLVTEICNTTFVPVAYRGKAGELLAAILTGDELGLPPMAAIGQIHNIQGRASLSAQAMRSIVLAKGHDIWSEELTNSKVVIGGRRANSTRDSFVTWTIQDAEKAGLSTKETWRKYPRAMLEARATGELCRMIFADVLAGIAYTVEELEDGDLIEEQDEPGAFGDKPDDAAKPPVKTTTRTAKPRKAAAAKAAPAQEVTAPAPAPADAVAELDELEAMAAGVKPGVIDVESKPLPPDRALAARAGELGINDHTRHGLYWAVSGSKTGSGKGLTTEQVSMVFDLFGRWDAVDVAEEAPGEFTVYVEGSETYFGIDESAADAAAGAPDGAAPVPDTEELWREYVKEHGRKIGETIKFGAETAKDSGVSPVPRSLAELASSSDELRHRVAVFVRTGE